VSLFQYVNFEGAKAETENTLPIAEAGPTAMYCFFY
jgi:hypothetical protein